MVCFLMVVLTISYNTPSPVFLDGDLGFYTSSSSFKKTGQLQLTLRESYGTKGEKGEEEKKSQNQTNLNIGYTVFHLVELGAGINYSSMGGDNYRGLLLKTKIPFLSISRMKSSISPCFTFAQGEKSYFTTNFDIEIIPFTRKNLPSFLLGQSVNIGKKSGETILQYSSLLTLHTGSFKPFVEFYTDFSKHISRSYMQNTRFCTGLGFTIGNLGFKTGVEIPLEDYSKKDFDFRLTGEINYLLNTKRKPRSKLNITVLDKENGKVIPATIMIKGKDVEKILDCKNGKCTIEDLSPGIYTIEIENPEYKRIKFPVFIKDKSLDKTYKLTKKDKKKGGDSSQ